MNYRHIYHAGNHADVLKHLLLTQVITAMQAKGTPFFCADLHAGIGLYDLFSEQSQKTSEYEMGITKLMAQADSLSEAFKPYLRAVKMAGFPQFYPGSPWLMGFLAGEQRIQLNELHDDDVKTLERQMRGFSKTMRVSQDDAYAVLKAVLPPPEKRALVLIDPPFEEDDEFDRLIRALQNAKSRFATGVIMIWYPIKSHLPVGRLYATIEQQGWHRAWCCEALVAPRKTAANFNGSGVIILNAPYPVPEQADVWLPELKQALNLHSAESRFISATT